MALLVAGLVAAALLLLLPRLFGRRQRKVLAQYEALEKRFGLAQRVAHSRSAFGMKEHISLHGESRGYPLALYDHYQRKAGVRLEWTSLVFEVLFTEELEICIEFPGTQEQSRFDSSQSLALQHEDGYRFYANQASARSVCEEEPVAQRLASIAKKPEAGAIRLSKGFLEYREIGLLEEDKQRHRYQEAILLLAHLSDALSLYAANRKRRTGSTSLD